MTASGKITSPSKRPSEGLQRAAEKARIFAELSRSNNTRRAYKTSWADFEAWCEQEGLGALPARPETVVLYVSDRADDLKLGTIGHRLAAISTAHKLAGYPNPASRREEPLRSIWQGMARAKGSRKEQKEPLLKKHLEVMVEELDRSCSSEANWLRNARDKALLLVGFAGAFRRSELSTMKVDDLRFDERGVQILVERSKTDTAGEGQWVGIPATGTELCPVRALRDWLQSARIEEGYVFRSVRHGPVVLDAMSTRTIANTIKKLAEQVGLDPNMYSGHSLRAGLITQAAQAGVAEVAIMRQSRHRSVPVLRQYVRKANVWKDNAAAAALG